MKIIFFFLILIIVSAESFGQEYEKYLLEANKIYESGDKEAAKRLYLKAANKGSAEAHFALAYKYIVTPEESVYHLSEAAKKGHSEALDHALDKLLFRANSLRKTDPQGALGLYYKAKKANPGINIHNEEDTLKVMKMCAEPKGFDAEKFMKKYGVEDEDEPYHVWELAEEASRGGRFGKPDPELIFNLVIRGAEAPAEFMFAVEEAYNNWKNGVVKKFNICDYVSSGWGLGYCASKANDKNKKERDAKLNKLKERLGGDSEQLLNKAYDSAVKFIELKARNEEGHGGSGRVAWMLGSEMEQKNQYLNLIEKINEGFIPSSGNSFEKADKKLNETYQKVINELEKKAEKEKYFSTQDDIRAVQRLWIPYRDSSVKLFVKINPSIDKNKWNTWFTEIRTKQLKEILELGLSY